MLFFLNLKSEIASVQFKTLRIKNIKVTFIKERADKNLIRHCKILVVECFGRVACRTLLSRWLSFLRAVHTATKLATMQAALMLRAKSRERRKQRLKRGIKPEIPTNVATKSIAPFPRYPPASWVCCSCLD